MTKVDPSGLITAVMLAPCFSTQSTLLTYEETRIWSCVCAYTGTCMYAIYASTSMMFKLKLRN